MVTPKQVYITVIISQDSAVHNGQTKD